MTNGTDNNRWRLAGWLWLGRWLLVLVVFAVGCLQVSAGTDKGTETLLMAFVLAVVSLPFWIRWRSDRKRSALLARFCARYQLSFRESCPTDAVAPSGGLPVFHRGEPSSVRNWMEGTLAGQPIVLLDYASGNNARPAGKNQRLRK